MAKQIRPTKIGNFGYGQEFDYGSFTLTEGDESYHVQIKMPHFSQFVASLSQLAALLQDGMDAVEGSAVAHPLQVATAEALPGADRQNVVLSMETTSGQRFQFALSVEACQDFRSMMKDAEDYTSGALGQSKQ